MVSTHIAVGLLKAVLAQEVELPCPQEYSLQPLDRRKVSNDRTQGRDDEPVQLSELALKQSVPPP